MPNNIRIATRKSPLALWQANHIKQKLIDKDADLNVELIEIVSEGDKDTSQPLVNIGGKALFVKALQQALLEDKADIAVHCIKDMSVNDVDGLTLAAICERGDARDVLVSNKYKSLPDMPKGSVLGTCSPRRRCFLIQHFPKLDFADCRGNVNSRLQKLDKGEFDGLILAAIGLERLGFKDKISEYFSVDDFVPAIGQACLGIECRTEDTVILEQIEFLNHKHSQQCVIAEREVNRVLGGDCHSAIAAHAIISSEDLILRTTVGDPNDGRMIETQVKAGVTDAVAIGQCAGENLLKSGAKKLLEGK